METLKAAIKATYDSEKYLKELVGVQTERAMTDEDWQAKTKKAPAITRQSFAGANTNQPTKENLIVVL